MIEALLDRLHAVRKVGAGSWYALCPAHQDRKPSLHITEKDDGAILLHDFGHQCGAADILAAVGLELKDLYPERIADHIGRKRAPVLKADVFGHIRTEALVLLLIAKRMRAGKLSDADTQRLGQAVVRLEQIHDAAYGSPGRR